MKSWVYKRKYSTKKYPVRKIIPNTLDKCQYCWNPVNNTHHCWVTEHRGKDLICGAKVHYECLVKYVNRLYGK